MVGPGGLEPLTSSVSRLGSTAGARRINRLHVRLSATVGSIGQGREVFVQRFVQRFLLTLLFLSTASLAQEKPDAPKPKHDRKVFIVGTALLAASQTVDAITTRRVLDRYGLRASENDPVFGRHPSPAKQAGVNVAFFAGQVLLFHYTERSHHRWVKWLGRANIGFAIEEHTRLAACNARLSSAQSCHQLD